MPKVTIFGTHNLQTCKHNVLFNELLMMQFLPSDASAERGNATVSRLSVRP